MYIQKELRFFSTLAVYDKKYDERVMTLFRTTRMNFEKTLDDNVKAAQARLIVLKKHVWIVVAWTKQRQESGMSTENLDIRMSPEQTQQFQASLLDYDILIGQFFVVRAKMREMMKKQFQVRGMGAAEMIDNKSEPRFLKLGYDQLWLCFDDCENMKKQYEQKIVNIFDTNGVEEEITGDVFGMTI